MTSPQTELTELRTATVTPYQFFMLALCGWSLTLLGAGTIVRWSAPTLTILAYADTVVCVIFLVDFVKSFYDAPSKWRYMRTWGWIDLLSSIPVIDPLRWGRAARLLRIVRLFRGLKSARTMAHFVLVRREQSAALASMLLSLLLLVCCSIAILEVEVPAGGNIASPEDAMWWAVSTMTTVGYGDRFPITSEGRLIAVFLMTAGVGTFGMLAGLIASWFLTPAAEAADIDREEIKALLLELRDMKRNGE